jgi:hypothetical protein
MQVDLARKEGEARVNLQIDLHREPQLVGERMVSRDDLGLRFRDGDRG